MKRNAFFRIGLVAWVAVVFTLCVMPASDIPDPGLDIPFADKIVHFGMHFVMAFFLVGVLKINARLRWGAIVAIAVAFSVLYGGVIEILQANCFNRSGDLWDELANTAGALAGCLSYRPLERQKDKWLVRMRRKE